MVWVKFHLLRTLSVASFLARVPQVRAEPSAVCMHDDACYADEEDISTLLHARLHRHANPLAVPAAAPAHVLTNTPVFPVPCADGQYIVCEHGRRREQDPNWEWCYGGQDKCEGLGEGHCGGTWCGEGNLTQPSVCPSGPAKAVSRNGFTDSKFIYPPTVVWASEFVSSAYESLFINSPRNISHEDALTALNNFCDGVKEEGAHEQMGPSSDRDAIDIYTGDNYCGNKWAHDQGLPGVDHGGGYKFPAHYYSDVDYILTASTYHTGNSASELKKVFPLVMRTVEQISAMGVDAKTPRTLYRGTFWPSLEEMQKLLDAQRDVKVVYMTHFWSTSKTLNTACTFAHGWIYQISVPAKAAGLTKYTEGADLPSSEFDEGEVLWMPYTGFLVKEVRQDQAMAILEYVPTVEPPGSWRGANEVVKAVVS